MTLPPICPRCQHYSGCASPCPAVEALVGRDIPLREKLTNRDLNRIRIRDYKQLLAELQAPSPVTIEEVRDIADVTYRAIEAMHLAHVNYSDIARIMRISRRQLYRIMRREG